MCIKNGSLFCTADLGSHGINARDAPPDIARQNAAEADFTHPNSNETVSARGLRALALSGFRNGATIADAVHGNLSRVCSLAAQMARSRSS
jgi:hypothetical protein